MSGHLCLKWNNHSTAFLKSISSIQVKEKYCDATIACQGKYFPVHRVILSTCSDYFEEMFERIQCPHPYIVFKDIEPREMELLLNYMYQGEVNVVQERLPSLIKAAEALRVKGLAVPDDLPSGKESSGKKRGLHSDESSQPKRRSEEKRRRRNSSEINVQSESSHIGEYSDSSSARNITGGTSRPSKTDEDEPKIIKEEPLDSCDYGETSIHNDFDDKVLPNESSLPPLADENEPVNKEESVFVGFPLDSETPYIKQEDNNLPVEDSFEDQSSSWTDFANTNVMQNPVPQTSRQEDILEKNQDPERQNLHEEFITSEGQQSVNLTSNNNGTAIFTPSGIVHNCPFCHYKSKASISIKRHIMFRHTGERPFACHICDKRFTLKTTLQMHIRTHTGEKPFQCQKCLKGFTVKSQLTIHLRSKFDCVTKTLK